MQHKVIAHIDMDAFFAAVEQRDRPELRGKPVVVGADPQGGHGRGVVSTCSYEARKFGIHSAQPISLAYQRCPHAVFVRGDHSKYSRVSKEIRRILYDFTPDIEPISIDEAFMDLTGSYHFYKTPLNTCRAIKKRIAEEVQLTASIGVAPVKFVAKIASDYCKPDGLLEIKAEDVLKYLRPLPIEKLWGVGPKTKQSLNDIGITTIGQIAEMRYEDVVENFGEHGIHLYNLSMGIDPREVEIDDEIKSVSHEHTFNEDTGDADEVRNEILVLSEKVSRRLRRYELKGRTVTVKIRLKGFKTYTRAKTLTKRTNLIDDIYRASKGLFDEFYESSGKAPSSRPEGARGANRRVSSKPEIRLIGVRVSNFEDPYIQDSLFKDEIAEKKEQIHKAVDLIKDKFGEGSIHRAL